MHHTQAFGFYLIIAMMVLISPNSVMAAPIDKSEEIRLDALGIEEKPKDETLGNPREGIGDSLQDVEDLEEIKQAKSALINNDVELCREKLRAAYAKHPNLSPPEMMLARLFLSAGQIATGRRLLEEVSIVDPDQPELYLLFGKLALLDGHVTDATLHFEKALSFKLPDNWTDAQRERFRSQCAAGQTALAEMRRDWDHAADLYQQQIKAQPQNAHLRDRLAMALFRDGQMRQAFEQFDIAYNQNPKLSRPEVSMAVMYVEESNFRKATEWFDKALARYADDPSVQFERSIALMHEDRATEADRHAAKAADLGLDNEALLMHRGLVAIQLAKFQQAEEFFQAVVDRTNYLGAKTSLALALAEQDDSEKRKHALMLARDAAREHPNVPMVKTILGWVQFRNGQFDEAEASLRAAAVQIPNDRATLFFLSRVLVRQQQGEDAERVAQQLERVLDGPGIFALRPAARRWLEATLPKKE